MSTHPRLPVLLPFSSLPKAISSALLGVALTLHLPLAAQPATGPQTSVNATYSFSSASDAEFAGATSGEVEINSVAASAAYTLPISEQLRLGVGVAFEHFAIDASAGVPVPDTLRTVALDLSGTWRIAPEWSLTARVLPGIYADGESFDSDGFNAPALLIATWRASETLTVFGGVRVDAFSDDVVLPAFGVRWQATPDIVVALGAPRTEVAYSFGERRSVFLGASFQGGAFHVDDPAVVPPAGHPSLRDTEVTYREIRVGAGVRWPLTDRLSLEFEGGWVADRRFEYDDRGLTVKTDDAAYGRIHLSARF